MTRKNTKLPKWCKEVQKSMIDMDMSTAELAEQAGYSRQFVAGVINGRNQSPAAVKRISQIVNVEYAGTIWQ